jgi:hypothetical protein
MNAAGTVRPEFALRNVADDFCCCDGLSNVPHGVIGDVN